MCGTRSVPDGFPRLVSVALAEATGPLIDVLRESDGTLALPVMEALGKLEALEAPGRSVRRRRGTASDRPLTVLCGR